MSERNVLTCLTVDIEPDAPGEFDGSKDLRLLMGVCAPKFMGRKFKLRDPVGWAEI